ncbi:TIGR01212 family radical SAM protein [Hominifimenecus sp. rT4P-3]|uniref:TIGR01212 family radical SAM protein n=1 Tax=Hominifimenecus sp. rT4P-3 TaxID=3242979 RepID=UPI003DA1E823
MTTNIYTLNDYCRKEFGEKLYKLSLNAGLSCPNRDGTLDTRGCIFCSAGGSGDFAAPAGLSIGGQIDDAKKRVAGKFSGGRYIAYFQAYTNTYGPIEYLEEIFTEAISRPEIAVLSIATRPDCLSPEVLDLLARLKRRKPVWVELGLQTIHEETARFIRRGYPLSCFSDAWTRLHALGIPVIAHVILGLPGEGEKEVSATIRYLSQHGPAAPIDGIKLQLLHVLDGTDLGVLYQKEPFPVLSLEEYLPLLAGCLRRLSPETVVHRLTGDGPKRLLLAPAWSADKKRVLNEIHRYFQEHNIRQGQLYECTSP